jgi:isoleucyl-tRNA synthetase
VEAGTPQSVHLASWPKVDAALIDDRLAQDVTLVRRLVELGRSARAESRVPTRQPLGRALVGASGWADLPADLRAEVAEELNVGSLEGLGDAGGELVDVTAKGNFRALGKRFGQRTPIVAAAIAAADAAALADSLRSTGTAVVDVDGESIEVTAEDVLLSETPRSGWAVAADAAETVALDLTITPELRRAGLAREAVRLIQDARKVSGLEVSDRIHLWWTASDAMAEALREHGPLVADEVLATQMTEGEAEGTHQEFGDAELGLRFRLRRAAR